MLGATIGFLCYNFNPAQIFLGDAGAMFVGFMMATLSIKLRFPGLAEVQSWMIPVLILGVPIFDMALVTVSRVRRGLVPFSSPGKDHTAHRLANLGLGQPGAVLLIFATGGLLGCLAILVSQMQIKQSCILMGVVGLFGLGGIFALERVPYESQKESDEGVLQSISSHSLQYDKE